MGRNLVPRVNSKDGERQKAFVDALFALSFNATAAAIAVGVPPKGAHVTAARWLKNAKVQEFMEAKRLAIAFRHDLTVDKIVDILTPSLKGNMSDYMRIGPNGLPYFDLTNVTKEQWSAIQEITTEEYTEGRGDDACEVRRIKVKLRSADAAADKLLRILGAYKDRPPGEGNGGDVHVTQINNNYSVTQLHDSYGKMIESDSK